MQNDKQPIHPVQIEQSCGKHDTEIIQYFGLTKLEHVATTIMSAYLGKQSNYLNSISLNEKANMSVKAAIVLLEVLKGHQNDA